MLLRFVRSLREEAEQAPRTSYREGYVDALNQVEEYAENELMDE